MILNDLAETLSLNGTWSFRLGEDAPWAEIHVPGCWEAQAFSKFLEGPATYRRKVSILDSWQGMTIQAEFDAAS